MLFIHHTYGKAIPGAGGFWTEASHEVVGDGGLGKLVKVGFAEVVVGQAGTKDVIRGDEDLVRDRHRRALGASPGLACARPRPRPRGQDPAPEARASRRPRLGSKG